MNDEQKNWNLESILSEGDKEFRSRVMTDIYNAYSVRENPHPQFDGMPYLRYHESNEKADNAYIPPKQNKIDKRVVSGVTRQKDNTLVSIILGMNFTEVVKVFDEDDQEIVDLSYVYTDLLKKANELDGLDKKLYKLYRQLFQQGNVFVRERFVEKYTKKKSIKGSFESLSDTKWVEKEEKEFDVCESEVLDPRTVVLGDVYQDDIQKQPYIAIVQHVNKKDVEAVYGKEKRWKYVPHKCTSVTNSIIANQTLFQNLSLFGLEQDKMEVIEFFDKQNNRYNVFINGVPMYDKEFPLSHPFISPSGDYPISKGDLNQFLNFAYGKSIPADTKFAEEILNQTLRLMIIKSEQSAFVPRGNLSGKLVNESIYYPSMITSDVSPKDLPALIENPGITPSDFNFAAYIDQLVSSMSVSKNLEGMSEGGGVTATQYLDQVKQSFKKLGISIDSVVNLRKQMAEKKLWNIISNWTRSVDTRVDESDKTIKKIYRKFAVDREVDGKRGTHIIQFTEDTDVAPQDEETLSFDILAAETEMSRVNGKDVMLSFVNPDIIRSMKYKFYIQVIPGETDNTTMAKEEFKRDTIDAMNIFGPQAINMEARKQEYARKLGKPYEEIFNPLADIEQPMMQQQVSPEAQAVADHNQMQKTANATGNPSQRPSDQMLNGTVQGLTNTKSI